MQLDIIVTISCIILFTINFQYNIQITQLKLNHTIVFF